MEQVVKLKRTWDLAPVLQIVQKISENYWPCLHLSTGQVWWLTELWFKRCNSKFHPVSCTNIYYDVRDILYHGMITNTKAWMSWERNITFLRNKKILNLGLRRHILRSYCFVAEVIFKVGLSPSKKIIWKMLFISS